MGGGDFRGVFDGAITFLLIVGVLFGILICGLGWLIYWLFHHLHFTWI